ncbi:MAG TPA: hypothetical protein VMF86_14830 [Stellaceae bacterium]|nr:hypothetical protein [Stellaceae bacterium]
MRNRLRWWSVGLSITVLIVCATQNAVAQNDPLMNQFRLGYAALNCGPSCQPTWLAQRAQALVLYKSGQWQGLAMLIMQTGYGDDLTWYYLGSAAQSRGYLEAAQRYYRASESSTATGPACATEVAVPQGVQALTQALSALFNAPGASPTNACDGFVFPAAAEVGLGNVMAELALHKPTRRRIYRRPHRTAGSVRRAASSPSIVEAPAGTAPPTSASSSGIVEAK